MTDVYVVAATGRWNRGIFDERLAARPGEWVFVAAPNELSVDRRQHLRPRYLFFLHWSWKVPAEILSACECIGFHMTDLPYGRGGSPLQNLILRGHRTTMLTAFRLTDEMDAGPIYLKAPLSLEGRAEEIYVRASNLAVDLIEQILDRCPTPTPQQGDIVAFQRRTPSESRMPDNATPQQLYDFIRMLDADGYPRAFAEYGEWRCEFSRASLEGETVRADARISRVSTKDAS